MSMNGNEPSTEADGPPEPRRQPDPTPQRESLRQPESPRQPVDEEATPRLPFAVVGIGASAGGLEAYSEFLDHVAADTGMAFVLVQHLPPKRESLLAELLALHTRMPVRLVVEGMAIEPNVVYVIRPGHTLTLERAHSTSASRWTGPAATDPSTISSAPSPTSSASARSASS